MVRRVIKGANLGDISRIEGEERFGWGWEADDDIHPVSVNFWSTKVSEDPHSSQVD